jgi:hypothetical protein
VSQFQVEKRFGYLAVDKGFISEQQLAEAMVLQIKEDLRGKQHRLVGQILLSYGYINSDQIGQVIAAMHFPLSFCAHRLRIDTHGALDTQPV